MIQDRKRVTGFVERADTNLFRAHFDRSKKARELNDTVISMGYFSYYSINVIFSAGLEFALNWHSSVSNTYSRDKSAWKCSETIILKWVIKDRMGVLTGCNWLTTGTSDEFCKHLYKLWVA
jgi:hypothetical protein